MKELKIDGGYSPIPWQLLDLVSVNAYKAFGKIYQCVFMNCENLTDGVEIPLSYFERCISKNRTSITRTIDELTTLGVIKADKTSRKKTLYFINWKEINVIEEVLKNVDNDGRDLFIDLIFNKEKQPLSQIDEKIIDELLNRVGFVTNGNECSAVRYNSLRTDEIGYKLSRMLVTNCNENEIRNNLSRIENDDTSQNTDKEEMLYGFVTNCNQRSLQTVTNPELFVTNCNTYNKEEKIYKKLVETRRGSLDRRESIEEDNRVIGEEEEEKDSKGFEGFSEVEENYETPSLFEEDDEESSEEAERRLRRKERYKKYREELNKKLPVNPYVNKPYYSKQDLEDFAGDIEQCTESPVKLYLFNLFLGLFDFYKDVRYIEPDDDGSSKPSSVEEYEPTFEDLSHLLIPVKDLVDIARNAYDDTKGQIELGEYSDAYGSVKVEADELPVIDPLFICDWHFTEDHKQILISTEGFRNIEEEDILDVPADSEGKEVADDYSEKARNLQYACFLSQTDNSSMTPLERCQKQFLERFVDLDEMFMVSGYKNNQGLPMEDALPWRIIQAFAINLGDVTMEQFFQSIFQRQEFKHGMDIERLDTIFSYKASQRVNKFMGFESKATREYLTEIRPNPYG